MTEAKNLPGDQSATKDAGLRNYLLVTAAYWAFTITDGAIHMLVVLHFHHLGYTPLEIAFLFLFYEVFGIITNAVGGYVGARLGLNTTMFLGMAMQVFALSMLAVEPSWLSVPYVMFFMAFSGVAKDLNKMSAKSSVKLMVPEGSDSRLFKWVAILTGSKNSLKGAGFFLGGFLLAVSSFQMALVLLAMGLLVTMIATGILLPREMGKSKAKLKFKHLFAKTREINILSGARFFLFGSRDVWFTVGLPVFLQAQLQWDHTQVGSFLALWVIGYGFVQGSAPGLLGKGRDNLGPDGTTARLWAFILALFPAGIALSIMQGFDPGISLMVGLAVFGGVFAINSSVHSYLILLYSDRDKVAMNVGFYYMANAAGRLVGTVLSGGMYMAYGLMGCLWTSVAFILAAACISLLLPNHEKWSERRQVLGME
ncbi:MAG: organoarsenical effux MFS transporter ArsJ [Magnetococcales bacterium]|nr:organoarsenical effux MFS transporter ArsJ [Magnetococcales bacterium]